MRVGLIIGHKASSQGASSSEGRARLTEYKFNEELAHAIAKQFDSVPDITPVVVYRNTYSELPNDINQLGVDFAISLHCNAFNTEASGTEVLYYHSSERGKELAEILQACLVGVLALPDRGIKPKHSEDRGGYLLRETNMPCVIAEPFFIDNQIDLIAAGVRYEQLVQAYTTAILTFAGS